MNNLRQDTRKPSISRRGFLVALSAFGARTACPQVGKPIARFGIVTDAHYAGADSRGTRSYRESFGKMAECVQLMNEQHVDFLIELGDFKDQDTPPAEDQTVRYLRTIESVFQKFDGPNYHVLGNHDMDSISKKQFLANVTNAGISSRSYYSFDRNHVHFVVLDANYRSDGTDYDRGNFDWTDANIPRHELDWLKQELSAATNPVIVFIHQLLDGAGNVFVNNAEQVRGILESSGNVLAVFQGHHHTGHYSHINGIHYYTLKAMVEGSGRENNSFAIIELYKNNSLIVTGIRNAVSKHLSR